MSTAKPKPYESACKCRRCSGKGVVYSQQSFSGVKGGRYSARTCPKCYGVGWKPPVAAASSFITSPTP